MSLSELSDRELMQELMAADLAAGCGHYTDRRWQLAYNEIAKRAGVRPRYFVAPDRPPVVPATAPAERAGETSDEWIQRQRSATVR